MDPQAISRKSLDIEGIRLKVPVVHAKPWLNKRPFKNPDLPKEKGILFW
jgi:hypothetical protein